MHPKIAYLLEQLLLSHKSVSCLADLRRTTCLFCQGDKADALYFIQAGLIKVTRTNASGGRFIMAIYGPHDLVGEECLSGGEHRYRGEAEVLSQATVYKIPWSAIERVRSTHPELTSAFVHHLLDCHEGLAHKVELLCLRDVESRILYYLEQLAKLVEPDEEDAGYPLPITQLELADFVGATRETTSTTLNQLERRGFVKLSRRLLTVYPRQEQAASAARQ